HTEVTATYWYITGVADLMAFAAQRFQRLTQGASKLAPNLRIPTSQHCCSGSSLSASSTRRTQAQERSRAIGTPFDFFYSSPSNVCVNRPPKLSLLISTQHW